MSVVPLLGAVFLLLAMPLFVWWLWCLVQALRVPDSTWATADQSKLVYVLLMVFVGLIGTIVYAAIARPALRRAGAAV